MPERKSRLNVDDWLRAGFLALVNAGPDALKAEPLARTLGTTKGSFYWHFKDVPEYRARLVAQWERSAVAALAQAAETAATPTERLHNFAGVTGASDHVADVERAIRAWARFDHTVADAVAEIDGARLAYIGLALQSLGLSNPDFPRLLYGAWLGMQALPGSAAQNESALSTFTAALLALQDA